MRLKIANFISDKNIKKIEGVINDLNNYCYYSLSLPIDAYYDEIPEEIIEEVFKKYHLEWKNKEDAIKSINSIVDFYNEIYKKGLLKRY